MSWEMTSLHRLSRRIDIFNTTHKIGKATRGDRYEISVGVLHNENCFRAYYNVALTPELLGEKEDFLQSYGRFTGVAPKHFDNLIFRAEERIKALEN